MKKILLLMTLFAGLMSAQADNTVVVNPVTVPQGGTGSFDIELNNETEFTAFFMALTLPSGISYVSFSQGSRFDGHSVDDGAKDGKKTFAALSGSSKPIKENSGMLIRVFVSADAGLAVGSVLNAKLDELAFTTPGGVEYNLTDVNFNITIGEARTLLDETSATAPTAENGVDVRVRRTINANEWSTICLPFAMSEAQAKAAFGSDVQLADFTGWETTEYDASDNALAIDVTFSSVTAIEANHPYVIKVSSAVTEFTVDGVDIAPEDDPAVSVGKKSKGTLGSFTGSYVPTLIDEECLFLNSNKFWYSTGKTNMKGYRGYFYFQDVLAAYAASAPVKMKFTLDGTTGIEDVQTFNGSNIQDGEIYDLAGRRVEKAEKGIYIINNKKVLVK